MKTIHDRVTFIEFTDAFITEFFGRWFPCVALFARFTFPHVCPMPDLHFKGFYRLACRVAIYFPGFAIVVRF